MELVADDELSEYICRENEKDYGHIQGKVSDKRRQVSIETLSKYVGAYEYTYGLPALKVPQTTNVVNVSLVDGELMIDRKPWIGGKSREPLVPLSDTQFAAFFGWQLHFVTDTRGIAIQLVFEGPEPGVKNVTAVRRR